MKKGILYSIAIVLVICIGYLTIYFAQYHIKNNPKVLQTNIIETLNSDGGIRHNPKVLSLTKVGSTSSYIALVQDKFIEYTQLTKGWNGKFNIIFGGNTGSISYSRIKTNQGYYGIMYGTNPNHIINHVNLNLNGVHLFYKIPEKDHFVVYKKLTKKESSLPPLYRMTIFKVNVYDKNNNIIPSKELVALSER